MESVKHIFTMASKPNWHAVAITVLEKNINTYANEPDYMHALGLLHAITGNLRASIQYFERGLSIDPNHVRCTSGKAKAIQELRRTQ